MATAQPKKAAAVDPRHRVMTPPSPPAHATARQLHLAAGVPTRMAKLKRVLGPRRSK